MMPRKARPDALEFDRRVLDDADLVELCRLVFRRHERLGRLIWLRAPEIIVRNEKRMLDAAVVALRSRSEAVPRPRSGSEPQLGARRETTTLKENQSMPSDCRSDRRNGRTAQPPAVISDDPWLLIMSANLLAVFGAPRAEPKPPLARLVRSACAGVVRLIGRGFRRLRESRRRAAAIRELQAQDDYMLKDMGLTRGEVIAAVDGRLDRGRPAPPQELKPAPFRGAAQEKPFTPAAAGRCTDGELDAAA